MTQVFPSRSRFIPAVLFKMLRNIGFQAVDMHFHSAYSMDAASSISSVLKKCKSRGYGVAITDHNEIKGAVRAWQHRKELFVIPGIEASTREGVHVLYYFYDIGLCKQFYSNVVVPLKKKNPFFLPLRVDELMDKARDYSAVACVAHPYGVGRIGIKKVRVQGGMSCITKKFNLAEGLNGSNLRKLNKKAMSWAHLMHKEMIAGSDGHITKELGGALTLAYGYDVESYLKSCVKGHAVLLGKELNIFVNALRQVSKERTYFRTARSLGLGWLWLTDHARELRMLDRKLRHSRMHYYARRAGITRDAYSNYVKLRLGGYDATKTDR